MWLIEISYLYLTCGALWGLGIRDLLWAIVHRLRGEEEKTKKALSVLLRTLSVAQAALTRIYTPQLLMYLSFSRLMIHIQFCWKCPLKKNLNTMLQVNCWKSQWCCESLMTTEQQKVSGRHDAPGRNDHRSGWAFKQMNQRI